MDRRDFLKSTAVSGGLFFAGCEGDAAQAGPSAQNKPGLKPKGPNILLINVDDMGYGDLSCHGNPVLKTPHIDKLYDESVRFTQFHVSPMCTPTRGQLLTGIDALKTGARWVGAEDTHLRTDLPTMAEIFRDAGYRTGLFGKWHVGDNYPMRPQDRGFEEAVWHPQQEIGTVNDYWGNDYFDDVYEHNGVRKQYEGYCTDIWFDLAMDWMQQRARRDEPFMCWIPTNVVHSPYWVEQKYRDRIPESVDVARNVESFFGMMYNLDDNMGRLENFLEANGLKDNTIVIFMSDNGATAGYNTYNAGMRGMKTHLWEGGHRVPLFIRWPNGNLRESCDIAELTQVQDLLPTLMELCDIEIAANAGFDGISLAEQLRGRSEVPDRILVVQFQRRVVIKKWDACIMWGPWRLLNLFDMDPMVPDEERDEVQRRRRNYEIKLGLFNIEDDPTQQNDVIDKYPDVVAKLKDHYEKWWEEVEPTLTIPRPVVIGNDAENPCYLAATAWAKTYFTNIHNVLDGRRANGYWNLMVDQTGEYEFALRRWPKEAETPISSGSYIKYTDPYAHGAGSEGKALPIKEARLQIGNFDQRKPVKADDQEIVFKVRLQAGNARLQTWFYDDNGRWLCGAYYVYVTRT